MTFFKLLIILPCPATLGLLPVIAFLISPDGSSVTSSFPSFTPLFSFLGLRDDFLKDLISSNRDPEKALCYFMNNKN